MDNIYTLKKAAEKWGVNLPTLTKHAKGDKGTVPLLFHSEANNASGTWLVTAAGMDRIYKHNLRNAMPIEEYDKTYLGMFAGKVVRNSIGDELASMKAKYAFNYVLENAHNSARDALLDVIDTSKPWGQLVMKNDLALTAFIGGLGDDPVVKTVLGISEEEYL